jgi:hypothetical protein
MGPGVRASLSGRKNWIREVEEAEEKGEGEYLTGLTR